MKYFHRELSNLIGWFEQVMVQTHLFELPHVEPANCDITLCGEISWIQGNGRVEVIHGSLPLRETHTHKPTTHYTHTHTHTIIMDHWKIEHQHTLQVKVRQL